MFQESCSRLKFLERWMSQNSILVRNIDSRAVQKLPPSGPRRREGGLSRLVDPRMGLLQSANWNGLQFLVGLSNLRVAGWYLLGDLLARMLAWLRASSYISLWRGGEAALGQGWAEYWEYCICFSWLLDIWGCEGDGPQQWCQTGRQLSRGLWCSLRDSQTGQLYSLREGRDSTSWRLGVACRLMYCWEGRGAGQSGSSRVLQAQWSQLSQVGSVLLSDLSCFQQFLSCWQKPMLGQVSLLRDLTRLQALRVSQLYFCMRQAMTIVVLLETPARQCTSTLVWLRACSMKRADYQKCRERSQSSSSSAGMTRWSTLSRLVQPTPALRATVSTAPMRRERRRGRSFAASTSPMKMAPCSPSGMIWLMGYRGMPLNVGSCFLPAGPSSLSGLPPEYINLFAILLKLYIHSTLTRNLPPALNHTQLSTCSFRPATNASNYTQLYQFSSSGLALPQNTDSSSQFCFVMPRGSSALRPGSARIFRYSPSICTNTVKKYDFFIQSSCWPEHSGDTVAYNELELRRTTGIQDLRMRPDCLRGQCTMYSLLQTMSFRSSCNHQARCRPAILVQIGITLTSRLTSSIRSYSNSSSRRQVLIDRQRRLLNGYSNVKSKVLKPIIKWQTDFLSPSSRHSFADSNNSLPVQTSWLTSPGEFAQTNLMLPAKSSISFIQTSLQLSARKVRHINSSSRSICQSTVDRRGKTYLLRKCGWQMNVLISLLSYCFKDQKLRFAWSSSIRHYLAQSLDRVDIILARVHLVIKIYFKAFCKLSSRVIFLVAPFATVMQIGWPYKLNYYF